MKARRHRTYLICFWLSLVTVFTHAVLPLGSPLARSAGSAFSAFTADVSLVPSRRGQSGKLKKQLSMAAEDSLSATSIEVDPSAGLPSIAPRGLDEPRPSGVVRTTVGTVYLLHIPVGFQSRAPPLA